MGGKVRGWGIADFFEATRGWGPDRRPHPTQWLSQGPNSWPLRAWRAWVRGCVRPCVRARVRACVRNRTQMTRAPCACVRSCVRACVRAKSHANDARALCVCVRSIYKDCRGACICQHNRIWGHSSDCGGGIDDDVFICSCRNKK
jgi:hypothetical protein